MYTTPINIRQNPITSFTPISYIPNISPRAYVNPMSSVIGAVIISDNVLVSPFASIRGDEGTPIYIGRNSNVQDGVVVHGLKDKYVAANNQNFSVFIGDNVSLAHQSQVHGPAKIGNNVFVGMQSFVFKSEVGDNVVIEPDASVIGVKIPAGRFVPAGTTINTQQQADNLPVITESYTNKDLNHEVTEVNKELNAGYNFPIMAYPPNYYLNQF